MTIYLLNHSMVFDAMTLYQKMQHSCQVSCWTASTQYLSPFPNDQSYYRIAVNAIYNIYVAIFCRQSRSDYFKVRGTSLEALPQTLTSHKYTLYTCSSQRHKSQQIIQEDYHWQTHIIVYRIMWSLLQKHIETQVIFVQGLWSSINARVTIIL